MFQLYTYFLYWCCLYIRRLLSDWMFLVGIDNICKIKYPVTARPRTYETRQPLDTKDAVHHCCCRAALVTLMAFPWVLIIQILWHVVGQANGAGSRSRLQIMITWVVTRPGTETVCVFTLENEADVCSVNWKIFYSFPLLFKLSTEGHPSRCFGKLIFVEWSVNDFCWI